VTGGGKQLATTCCLVPPITSAHSREALPTRGAVYLRASAWPPCLRVEVIPIGRYSYLCAAGFLVSLVLLVIFEAVAGARRNGTV
jgi:hypothetical protein